MSLGGLYYPAYTQGLGAKARFQTTHPFRNLVAAGSHANNQWSGDNGYSGYGLESADYDYHSGPPAHMPSGGSYTYATAGTGYGPPVAHGPHPPPKPHVPHPPSGGNKGLFGGVGGGGKRSSSALSAVTLLSFLFFINLLQSCVKDHMDAMNPTVMVMTTNVIRNHFNKMGEMNSREQQSSSSNVANIVMQPADLVHAAAAQAPPVLDYTKPSVKLQTTFSHNTAVSYKKPTEYASPHSPSQYINNMPEPEVPISYAKPIYDPSKPDSYDHLTPPHHTLSHENYSLNAQPPPHKLQPMEQQYNFHHTEYTSNAQPPPHKLQPMEQQYNFHHTEYTSNDQSPPRPSITPSQYTSSSQNPFYVHQQPAAEKPSSNSDYGSQYAGSQHDYDIRQKYGMTQQQQHHQQHHQQNYHFSQSSPFNSDHHSSSVASGPFRRASIVAVPPNTRWISVPAKIIDRTRAEEIEEDLEHHDDRDVFRDRLN